MKKIVILGGGPRGLAIALQAILLKYDVTIIDEKFLSTWTFPNMVTNLQMRSPISFDLTTLIPNLQSFSLSSFLDKPKLFYSLQEVEECDNFCNRTEFVNYLNFIISNLKKLGVKFLVDAVKKINTSTIETIEKILYFDYLIIASGKYTQINNCPIFLKDKFTSLINIYTTDWFNKDVYIIGDGQQSAEYINYLNAQKANITWLIKKEPKISQYPVPSIKEWGAQSAFSDFFVNQININDKNIYLENVKNWGPSITPYIHNLIKDINIKILKNIKTTNELNFNTPFILATGYTQDINLLNFSFNIKTDRFNSNFPNIKKDFQSKSHPNIYFTGLLASRYDGPRQGSLISSANTAQVILNSIKHN